MAKNASKASKTIVNARAAAVAACFGIVYPALVDSAAQSAENAKRRASRSETCVAGIKTLRATLTDKAEYSAAVVELFGNGEKKKDVRVAGSLFDKLKAEGVKDVTTFSLLHHCRTVAANWDNADVAKAATESGIRAGYDATKTPKDAETKAETPKVKDISLAELIAEMAKNVGGLTTMAKMMESACIANKDPIRAAVCHEYAVKLTAAS